MLRRHRYPPGAERSIPINDKASRSGSRGHQPVARQHPPRLAQVRRVPEDGRRRGARRHVEPDHLPEGDRRLAPTTTRRSRRSPDPRQSAEDVFFELAIEDVREAADQINGRLRRHRSPRRLRVVRAAARHGQRRGRRRSRPRRTSGGASARPNIFIKIPGTAEGVPAIEESIAAGINVNVTLLFSLAQLRGHPLGVPPRPRAAGRAGRSRSPTSTRWRASSSPASTPRSTRCSPEGSPLRGQGGRRQRQARLPALRRDHGVASGGRRWPSRRRARCSGRCGRPPARRTRSTRTSSTSTTLIGPELREHDARPDDRGVRGSRHGRPHGRRRRRRGARGRSPRSRRPGCRSTTSPTSSRSTA